MPILECHALEKRYGSAMALDHIDLALEPGRIIGLLGPNGSGKSTLIKLAMGLLQPTSGELLIDGQTPSPQTNAIVSYLPDRVTLSPWMKTRQLLDFYCDFYADFDRQAAERMLTHLGLNATARASFAFYNTDEDVDRFIESLSTLRERMGYGK